MQFEKQKPWHGIGVDVDANLSSREMLYKAKLDWEVSKIPSQRPKSYANQETLRFFKGFFEAGEAHIETIGSLDASRILWGFARLNENFTLQGGDEVSGYILLASRNESREKIEVQFIIVRESCYNILQIASDAKPHVKNIFRRTFKPTFPFMNQKAQKFDDEMKKKVSEIVVQGRGAISAFADDAQILADKKVDEAAAWRFMFDLFQPTMTEDVAVVATKELAKIAENKTKLAMKAFAHAPGQELRSANMTAWGLLSAVTYTVDHHLGSNRDSRLRQAWFGPNAKLKKRALALALSL